MGRVDVTALTPEQMSYNLLECVKKDNVLEAFSLLDSGADPNTADPAGNTALHHAALGGNVDLVVKMIQHGGNVRKMDENGETPLHKAARRGRNETLAALMVYGGDIDILNTLGQSALELAVMNKYTETVKLCCRFGAEAVLQDWIWTMGDMDALAKQDRAILEILVDQTSRYPGYKYGAISFKILHLKPNSDEEEIKLQNIDISIKTKDIKDDFFLYCCKMHPEYSNIRSALKPEESIFSDIYEFEAWGRKPSKYVVSLTVAGTPSCSERMSLKALDGSPYGHIESFKLTESTDEDEMNYTKIDVSLPIGKKHSVKFAVVTTEVPETFRISTEAVCIKPTMEPEAKIDIPAGTFEGQGHIHISVAETKLVVTEETELSEPLLVTNILDLTMSDGKQPKKAVRMTLPTHSESHEDIIILASQEEYPEEEEDWEIIEANGIAANLVTFNVTHFSFYVAGSKANFKKAAQLANQALRKERKIEIFVLSKYESETNSTIIVGCATKTKGKRTRKKWKNKGFLPQSTEYYECLAHSQEKFRLTFSESLPVQDRTRETVFIFNPKKKKNYMTFNLIIQNKFASGEVKFERMYEAEEPVPEPEIVNRQQKTKQSRKLWLVCGGDSLVVEKEDESKEELPESCQYEELVTLPVEIRPTEEADEEDIDAIMAVVDPNDPECSFPVLRYSSLERLSTQLDDTEAYNLGVNLGVSQNALKEIKEAKDFKVKMFHSWRPKRPYKNLVQSLVKCLERIDRKDLSNMVQLASNRGSEFKYIDTDDVDD